MVSKPTGPRPPQQNRGKRRAPQSADRAPDVVDRSHEPQAGPSHLDRPTDGASRAASGGASSMTSPGERTRGGTGAAAAAAAHSHTMPPGLSLSGQVPAPSKSGKGGAVKGAGSGRTVRRPQTLPGHASRVPPSLPSHSQSQEELRQGAAAAAPSRGSGSATSRPATQRGLPQGAVGGGPIRVSSSSNVMSNSLRVEVHKEHLHTHRRDPNDRHSRQAHSLPGHAAATAGGSSGPGRDATVSSAASSKYAKNPKERYIRHAQHKQQAATLPPGGASGSGGPRTVHASVHVPAYNHSTTSRPAPPPPTATSTVSAPTNSGTTATSSHSQSHRTSRDPTERRQDQPSASVSVVPVQGGREHDIARITVDARAIVTRQTGGSADNNLRINLHHRAVSGAGAAAEAGPSSGTVSPSKTKEKGAPPSSQPLPTYSLPHSHNTTRRGAAPAPPGTAGGNVPTRASPLRTVDPSSLRVDVIDPNPAPESLGAASDHVLMTNRLSTGISYGRPERLETTEALPDILNSHILPPYTVRQNQHRPARQHQQQSAGASAGGTGNGGGRGRSRRRSRRSGSGMTQLDDDEKGCCSHEGCMRCVTVLTTFRWVLASLALLGVLCVITGIVLGALHMTVGSSFLTLSLMFIGLGLMLVVVVGVGWKCTPQGHEPCHLLFNLGDHCTRDVRSTSHRRHRERNHWYGGVTYPEFRYRRPPPSYNASMQEFQQQLMIAQLQLNNDAAGVVMGPLPTGSGLPPGSSDDNYSLPSSPPPSYKSRASTIRPGLHITFPPQGDNSQPPTYRSRAGGTTRPALHHLDDCGVDNPACSDADGPWSSETECSASSSAPTSTRTSPARSLEDSVTSTMHRADQVVGYLDDVLQRHDRTLEHVTSGTEGARGHADQGAGARALTVPRTGLGEGTTARTGTAPKVGTGTGAGATVRTGTAPKVGTGTGAGTTIRTEAGTGAREKMPTKTPLEGGLTSGVSQNSVRTSASLEETDRIQDTQL